MKKNEVECTCARPGCGNVFTLKGARLYQVRFKQKHSNAAGPYCSRGCAGKDYRYGNKERVHNDVDQQT